MVVPSRVTLHRNVNGELARAVSNVVLECFRGCQLDFQSVAMPVAPAVVRAVIGGGQGGQTG